MAKNPPHSHGSGKTQTEPTKEQLGKLNFLGDQMRTLFAEHGKPDLDGISEQTSLTLEESLKRVENLLNNARGLFNKAESKEKEIDKEKKRLETQARDQDESLRHQKKELANERKELDQSKSEFHKEEQRVKQRSEKIQDKEAELSGLSSRLTERELNAEKGFLVEKARVLKPIEEEVIRLREERDRLIIENAERSHVANQAFDTEMSAKKQKMLSDLHLQLRSEREKAETEWQNRISGRQKEVEDREQVLGVQERRLRQEQQKLLAEQEIFADDRAALANKIERMVAEKTENLRHEKKSLEFQLADARAKRDDHFKELESRREFDRRLDGRTPKEVLDSLTLLEKERDELAQQLRERPDSRVAERLAALERERSVWLEERALLQGDLAKANGELATRRLSSIELESLRKQKEALEVHKELLNRAVDELSTRVNELTKQEGNQNPLTSLTSLDESETLQTEVRTSPIKLSKDAPCLAEFAEGLRHRIATGVTGRTLYYSERDVRAFLGGLAMTRLMLLQGISGTGKTSLPLAFANAVDGGVTVVPVQAGWRDRQDLIGYFNAFHGRYYGTPFLEALYTAGTPAYKDRPYLIVLDEINLSRPEQFFADFLSELEQPVHQRKIGLLDERKGTSPKLMPDGKTLSIPPNVWFIGTANHDESTAEFADKTYDRAHVMEMPRKTKAAHFQVRERAHRYTLSYDSLESAFNAAAESQKQAVQASTTWLQSASFTDDLHKRFRVGWGNRLENQLARYLPVVVESGGSIGEAMDHLLVTKVLRKLKDRHDVRAAALEELSTKLQTAWDKLDSDNPPERCVALIEHEIAAKKNEELV